jgi:hypothetical protein
MNVYKLRAQSAFKICRGRGDMSSFLLLTEAFMSSAVVRSGCWSNERMNVYKLRAQGAFKIRKGRGDMSSFLLLTEAFISSAAVTKQLEEQ